MNFFVNSQKPISLDIQRDTGVDGVTMGHILKHRAEATPQAVAYRSKHQGRWVDTTWQQAYQRCQNIAAGLISLGLSLGERVGILSSTREEWTLSDFGIVSAGGVSVPIYASNPPDVCAYILGNSDAIFVFVEDERQFAKLKEHQSELAVIKKVFVFNEMIHADEWAMSLVDLEKQGAAFLQQNPHAVEDVHEKLTGESLAVIAYTSGTTGQPKGALLTHNAFAVGTRYALAATPAQSTDIQLMFLPLAHSFGHMLSVYAVRVGFCTAFAESIDKLVDNIAEIRPTCLVCVPRIFEKVHQGFLHKAQEGSRLKRALVTWLLSVGKRVSKQLQNGKKPNVFLKASYFLADVLVFRKLRARLGNRLRWFISGSAPLSTEIIEFFHAAGMIVLEGYGLTETNSITSVNRLTWFKFGSVGVVHHPDIKVKLAEDGEILTKGITNFLGYHKLPSATQEAFDKEGWFRTGDIGSIDTHGFITITDRKKDLIKTSGGKFVAPQMLEGKLKLHPFISQAVIVGDRHQYITALLAVNTEAAQKFLKQNGISIDEKQIQTHNLIHEQLQAHLAQVNKDVGSWEQVKYFRILPRELTEADGEMTPSLKVKRKVVMERYQDLIDSMYPHASE